VICLVESEDVLDSITISWFSFLALDFCIIWEEREEQLRKLVYGA
jgi:hypothetical protein